MNAEQQGQHQQHPEVSFMAEENENEPMLDNNDGNNNNPSSNNNNDDDANMNNHDEEEQQPVDNEPNWNEIQLHEPAQESPRLYYFIMRCLCSI